MERCQKIILKDKLQDFVVTLEDWLGGILLIEIVIIVEDAVTDDNEWVC